MSRKVTVREFRFNLSRLLRRVAAGEQVVITRRGKAVARVIPEPGEIPPEPAPYPLRGSVLAMSEDFDEPVGGLWEALEK